MPRPTPRHEQLVRDCRAASHAVFGLLHRRAGAELLSLDLSMGQFKALMTLTGHGPLVVGELGRRLALSEPGASLLVDKLEAQGLASRARDPRDRRCTLVTATQEAHDLAARLREGREEHVVRWLEALDEDELEDLLHGLRALARVAAQDEAAAAGPGDGCPHTEARHG